MNVHLYQDMILTVDLPEQGLCAGDVGTLVERHEVPGKEVGYSVEFFDMTGRTVAVVTLPSSLFRLTHILWLSDNQFLTRYRLMETEDGRNI